MSRSTREAFQDQLKPYGVAVSAVAVATMVRWLIGPSSTQILPFATYFPAVMVAALYGGFRPCLFSALASLFIGEYLFVAPAGAFPSSGAGVINGVVFLANAILTAALAAKTRTLLAERKRQNLALETLHAEQGHRISNKLAFITSLVEMQIKTSDDENVRAALEQTLARVQGVAHVHQHLQRGIAQTSVDAEAYLGALCRNMTALIDGDRVHIDCQVAQIELDIDRALPFGMILTELMTNALKHAYPPPARGQIRVRFDKQDKEFVLVVSDDGAGLPENFERTGRLGVRVIRALVAQLRGTLNVERDRGTTFEVRAPA